MNRTSLVEKTKAMNLNYKMIELKIAAHTTIAVLLCSMMPGNALAQDDGQLPSDEIEVIKNFEARLAVSDKLGLSPQLPAAKGDYTEILDYSIYPQSIQVDYNPPKIRPLAMRRDRPGPSYKGYIEGGYGTPNAPYAFGAYEHSTEDWGLGIGINHYSADNKDANHLTISQTKGNIRGNYLLDKQVNIFGGFDYGRHKRYYNLDYLDSLALPDSTESRLINHWSAHAGLENLEDTELGIDYKAELYFERAGDELNTLQNLFRSDFSLTKYINDENPVGLDFGNYLSTYKSVELLNQDMSAFYASPYFKFGFDKFRIKLGLDFWTEDGKGNVYPDIDLMVNLKDNQWVVFAETEGRFNPSDFISNIERNPFLSPDFEVNFQKTFDVFGGLRGKIRGLGFTLKGGWQSIENLALHVNDPSDRNKFLISYDTATVTYISGEFNYQWRQEAQVFTKISQKFFNLENADEAFHTPAFRWDLGARYWTLEQRLLLGLNVFVENGLFYLDENQETQQLNALFDVSFDVRYLFTDQFGAFLKLNNIANNEREWLRHYSTFGFNVLGGLYLRF